MDPTLAVIEGNGFPSPIRAYAIAKLEEFQRLAGREALRQLEGGHAKQLPDSGVAVSE